MSDDFFIGWSDNNPRSYIKIGRLFFLVALLMILAICTVYTFSEEGFIDSYFEYGTLTEVKGDLVATPVWGLRTVENGEIKTIPLVGFGKHGPQEAIRIINARDKIFTEGANLTLRGTMFHYKDRSWMELTETDRSLVAVHDNQHFKREISNIGMKTLEGEILDPKCFFGVMNPAEKAVHRSCAIRCISGGIPAVLGIRENGEFVDYYFLVAPDHKPLTKEVLEYVGLPVKISGNVTQYDDWKVLEFQTQGGILMSQLVPQVQACGDMKKF